MTAQSHRLRIGRFSQAGNVYLLTAVTQGRAHVFEDFTAARCLIHQFRKEAELGRAKTLCFVVMPDHFHWLMQLGQACSLSMCMRSVKSLTARQLKTDLWAPGFHDRAMRQEEDLQAMARYVVANPVRAGLVAHVGDYPHWDACWL